MTWITGSRHHLTANQVASSKGWPSPAEYSRMIGSATPRPSYLEMRALHCARFRVLNERSGRSMESAHVATLEGTTASAYLRDNGTWSSDISDDSGRALKRWDYVPEWPQCYPDHHGQLVIDAREHVHVYHGAVVHHHHQAPQHIHHGGPASQKLRGEPAPSQPLIAEMSTAPLLAVAKMLRRR